MQFTTSSQGNHPLSHCTALGCAYLSQYHSSYLSIMNLVFFHESNYVLFKIPGGTWIEDVDEVLFSLLPALSCLHFDRKRRSKWVSLTESSVRPKNMQSHWWILPFIVCQGEAVLDWRSAGHIILHLHLLMVSWVQVIVETGLLSLVALLGVFLLILVRYIPSSWAANDNNAYPCSEMLLGESVICLRIDYGFFTSQWTC